MKRSKLRNFLVPSIVLHATLAAIVVLAVVLFVEEHEEKGDGTIIVGIMNGEGPARKEESAREAQSQTSTAKSETVKQEERSPLQPVITKERSVIETEADFPNKQPEANPAAEAKTIPNSAKKMVPSAEDASDVSESKTMGIETATIGTGDASLGTSSYPALDEKAFKSAYPDYKVNPKPVYPNAARRRGYEGDVKLRVLVMKNGKVGKIEIEKPSGYEVLDESALKTVNEWIFVPGTENGKEVSSWVTVPISFRLKSG